MQRFWEFIFGLDRGFLDKQGDLTLQFHPQWPLQEHVTAGLWNFLLVVLAVVLVVAVYKREGRPRPVRITLGAMRLALLLLVIALLNRPVLTLVQSRVEPSVLAIMIDDSISMRVRDAGGDQPATRLEAVTALLTDGQGNPPMNRRDPLLRLLAKQHQIRFYKFSRDAEPIGAVTQDALERPDAVQFLADLNPGGQATQVAQSVASVARDLQGQRVAGVVVLTDGRETPAQPIGEALKAVKDFGVKIFPVAVGSEQPPTNVDVQGINVQETVFKGDLVNVQATVRGSGFAEPRPVRLVLKDGATGQPLLDAGGQPAERDVTLSGGQPTEVELHFKPEQVGPLDVLVEATAQPGELDDEDNTRVAQVQVLDAKVALLYVDGYPRWEYRYLKNEMIRDRTVEVSCLLTSADPNFAQEGDKPITRFPESIEEILAYDVILFGDVDPRQFTDAQLQLVYEFVAQKGGGFGMIAGPRWSPHAYRNTPVESILPVSIARVGQEAMPESIAEGFRPVLTKEGAESSIFRFFADREANEKYIREYLPPVFWYSRGAMVKPGVGQVYAEHPDDVGPDGRKAPLLVLGRFGAGRTLFSSIDDSWRWRFYTGESIFDTYWVQQIRYLARGRKLGQRRMMFTTLRPVYELGEQVRVNLRVLDPQLLQQLPEQLRVEILNAEGQVVRQENLVRQEREKDLYVASWSADGVGRFVVKLPQVAGGVESMDLPLEVAVPRLELVQPEVDRTLLSRLASETLGQMVAFERAREDLPTLIPSAAKVIPIETGQPLWDAPLAMAVFILLITAEWVARKMYGMV